MAAGSSSLRRTTLGRPRRNAGVVSQLIASDALLAAGADVDLCRAGNRTVRVVYPG
ncbi:hypothetical protein OH799_01995 [Nocardia sp. NBC_00881]|uniref:hypothetical protein n=1 Tax=Nocardia sp. NBC_00881 TaxID=2975995 RepID=UPI003869F782|nr:hypothetical protein OH799_01995 [Nocardia sp. NBC_00881]